MALQTSHKWMIAIFAIIVLLVIAWFVYKSIPKSQGGGAPPVDTTHTNPGLLELASGFLGGAWIKNIFGKHDTYQTTGCDPNNPGFNLDGLYDNNCQ